MKARYKIVNRLHHHESWLDLSLTIFYIGSLKDGREINELADIIARHVGGMDADLVQESIDSLVIHFDQGTSEPMAFRFTKRKVDDFCKWNGTDAGELYSIFDMLYELRPLFKRFMVNDDEGLWYQHVAEKTPCKIELRALTDEEEELLTRMESNVSVPVSDVESFLMEKTRYRKANAALARLVVQDFIKATDTHTVDSFEPAIIAEKLVNMNIGYMVTNTIM